MEMEIEILKTFCDVEPYLQLANQSADKNRKSFGFLPNTAYIEQANKGQLWVAVDKESRHPLGHIMFGGRFPQLKVMQLLVYSDFRKSGIGNRLINELIKFGEENNFILISARVASDLSANHFWGKMGFVIVRQEKGGDSRKRTINIRVKELDTTSLFKGLPHHVDSNKFELSNFSYKNKPLSSTLIYAIDLNVFYDITKQRKNSESSSELIRAGFNHKIRLCVSHEFVKELERYSSDNIMNDPVLCFARELPSLPVVENDEMNSLISELRTIVFPHKTINCKSSKNDNSDLTHLAACIHHRIYGFVTREVAILNCSSELKRAYGVEVVSPSDLCSDSNMYDTNDFKVSVDSGTLSIDEFDENNRVLIERFLIKFGLSEDDLGSILNPGANGALRCRLVASYDGSVIGVSSWDIPSKYTNTIYFYIYVDEASIFSENIIDHFIETVARSNIALNIIRINLITYPLSEKCIQTAMERGFRRIDGVDKWYLSKIFYSGPMFCSAWSEFKEKYEELTGYVLQSSMPTFEEFENTGVTITNKKSKEKYGVSLFDFETIHMHGIIACKGRCGILIPIRQCYAKELFNEKIIQEDLFPYKESLLHVEKSYFRKPKGVGIFKKGVPVIFYVSGKDGGPMQVIGCARITFSEKLSPEDIEIGLARQGALSPNELIKMTDKSNKLHAITFDNFNLFPNRVSYNDLKNMGCIGGANLVTSELLPSEKLQKIFKLAYATG